MGRLDKIGRRGRTEEQRAVRGGCRVCGEGMR